MFATEITKMLGIKYPIIQGGMAFLARAELAAAVSNAGGLGILVASCFNTKKGLKEEIRKTRALTGKPFGVNISLMSRDATKIDKDIEVITDEGISIVETNGPAIFKYVPWLKKNRVKILHKVTSLRHALAAQRAGADAVAIYGYETGGHLSSTQDVTMLVQLPIVVDSLKIPVIAAGGIGDARGFVAALALGAQAVIMGTRFMATRECPGHPRFKEWLVRAKETDTTIIGLPSGDTHRVLRNQAAEAILAMERKGLAKEALIPFFSGVQVKKIIFDGDLGAGPITCGQVVGLIHEVVSVQELIENIIIEAQTICQRLNI
jgi:NAD(P)H-dependent flavin oxidoreductase YrpB (nitropropane dioxygenase family)